MSHISWSRAAYVFFVLAVLAALLKLGTFGLSDADPLRQASAKVEARANSAETHDARAGHSRSTEAAEATAAAAVEEAEDLAASAGSVAVGRGGDPSIVPRETEDGTLIFYRPVREKAGRSGDAPSGDTPSGDALSEESSPEEDAPALGMSPSRSGESGPVCGNLRDAPKSSEVVFPLSDEYFDSYDDTWGAARPQGGHEGTDLMTPMKTPEYAMTDGTVVPVSGANGNGWNTLGGYTLMLRADYSVGPIQEGDLFYYAHMDREAPLAIGTRVRAGQLIGYAGDTGQGSEVTRGLFPPHLHLGWYDTSGDRTDLASGAMNPFPLLEWVKSNGGAVSGGTDAKFCTAPQNGDPVPSTGESNWPFPMTPGTRPDIDTGTSDAAPSPVVKRDPTSPEKAPGTSDRDKPRKDIRKDEKPGRGDREKPDADKPSLKPNDKPNRPRVPKVEDMLGWIQDLFNDRNDDRDAEPRDKDKEKKNRDKDRETPGGKQETPDKTRDKPKVEDKPKTEDRPKVEDAPVKPPAADAKDEKDEKDEDRCEPSQDAPTEDAPTKDNIKTGDNCETSGEPEDETPPETTTPDDGETTNDDSESPDGPSENPPNEDPTETENPVQDPPGDNTTGEKEADPATTDSAPVTDTEPADTETTPEAPTEEAPTEEAPTEEAPAEEVTEAPPTETPAE